MLFLISPFLKTNPQTKGSEDLFLKAFNQLYFDKVSNSSSVSSTSAAFKFSSKCATDLVPGISRILFARFSNHASAICAVVA